MTSLVRSLASLVGTTELRDELNQIMDEMQEPMREMVVASVLQLRSGTSPEVVLWSAIASGILMERHKND